MYVSQDATPQTLSDGSTTQLEFDTVRYDDLNEADLDNNRIVVSESGLHHLYFHAELDDSADGEFFRGSINVNGTPEVQDERSNSDPNTDNWALSAGAGTYLKLEAGDVVTATGYLRSSTTRNIQNDRWSTHLGMVSL